MSYRSIITHVEADPAAGPRVQLAAALANRFEASLIGVGAELFEPPSAAASMGYVDGVTLVAEAKVVEGDFKLAEQSFRDVARTVKAGSEWRTLVAPPAEVVSREARAADLVVAGPRRAEPYGFHNHADPGELVMTCGRPVLVAPLGLARLDAMSVLVAWKEARESRRAVADALPFLERARDVLVAEVCEDKDEEAAGRRVADVAGYLARHGIKARTAARAPGEAGVVATLLEMADMHAADLIVAGGYGHSRLREWAFGGVTRELLCGQRAVLLSH